MQTDLKRVIAYSSVAHMGFIVLGIFSLTIFGLDGAVFTMLSHPLTTGALFLVIGMLYERRHTREIIATSAGIWKSAPILTAFFLDRDVRRHRAARLLRVHRRVPRAARHVPSTHRWWAVVATIGVDPRRGLHALDVPAGVHRRARG